jgi:hypothetical protein
MEKQWYMVTHKRIGVVDIWEIHEDDVVRYAQDYEIEPVVVMTKEEYDKAIDEAEKRGRTWRGGW